jgi:hypothetical protein
MYMYILCSRISRLGENQPLHAIVHSPSPKTQRILDLHDNASYSHPTEIVNYKVFKILQLLGSPQNFPPISGANTLGQLNLAP